MALTIEEIFTSLGVDGKEIKSIEDFNTKFGEKFKTEDSFFEGDAFKNQIGKVNGMFNYNFRQILKKTFDVEMTKGEYEGKDPKDVIALGLSRLQEKNNEVVEGVRKENNTPKDEAISKLEKERDRYKTDYSTLTDENKRIKEDWEKDKATSATQIKNEKLSFREKDLYANFKWASDVNDISKLGFKALINGKAKFDLDENDNLIVTDKDGKKFGNPKSASAFLSPQEFLQKEGIESKVYALNPDKDAGKKTGGFGFGGSGFGAGQAAGTGEGKDNNGQAGQQQQAGRKIAANTYSE